MFWVLFAVALLCAAFIGAKLIDNLWQYHINELLDRRKTEAEELRAQLREDPDAPGKNHLSLRIAACDRSVHVLDDLLLARRRHFR